MDSLPRPSLLLNNSGHSLLQTLAACTSRLCSLSPLCSTGFICYPWRDCTCCTVCNTVIWRSLTQRCGLGNDGEMTPLYMIPLLLNYTQNRGKRNDDKWSRNVSRGRMKWQDRVGRRVRRLNSVGNDLTLLFSVAPTPPSSCSRTCGLCLSPRQQDSPQLPSQGKIYLSNSLIRSQPRRLSIKQEGKRSHPFTAAGRPAGMSALIRWGWITSQHELTVYMWWDLGEGRGRVSNKDVYCLINRDWPSEKKNEDTNLCLASYIISVCISSIYLHGNEYGTLLHLQSEESSVLMPPGQCALGWLASTLWHLYLTDRLIIGWLNKSCPLGIDFCPRQMIYI